MAPAAADLIYQHLTDFGVKPTYYDRIITGDLGKIGQRILLDLLQEKMEWISANSIWIAESKYMTMKSRILIPVVPDAAVLPLRLQDIF